MRYLDLDECASPLTRAFGQRVRERRHALKLTISDIFHETGVTVSYISAIERGRANPSLSIIEKLAAAVGKEVHQLLLPVIADS